jgi:hypothetical protein
MEVLLAEQTRNEGTKNPRMLKVDAGMLEKRLVRHRHFHG